MVSSLLGSGGPSIVIVPICSASRSFTSLRRSCSEKIMTVPTQVGLQSAPTRNFSSIDQRSSIRTFAPFKVSGESSPCFTPSTYHRITWRGRSAEMMIRWMQLFLITLGFEYTPIPQDPSLRTKNEPGCLFSGSVCKRHVYERELKSGTITSMMIVHTLR